MIRSKYVSICSLFHARWANSGKITISKGGTPLWCPRSRGISSRSGTNITAFETIDYRLSYGEDPESLSHSFVSAPGHDRRTESPSLIHASAVPAGTAVARKKLILIEPANQIIHYVNAPHLNSPYSACGRECAHFYSSVFMTFFCSFVLLICIAACIIQPVAAIIHTRQSRQAQMRFARIYRQ